MGTGTLDHPVSRRRLLQQAAGAAAVGGLALAGCGRKAQPTTQSPIIVVTFQPYIVGGLSASGSTSATTLVTEGVARFASEGGSKGITIKPELFPGTSQNVSAMEAGSGPDIVCDYQYAAYVDAGLLAPIEGYLKQSGINPKVWSSSQVAVYQQDGHMYAVPAYTGIACYAVNLSLFDTAGQPYPEPSWTYTDFQGICKTMTTDVNGTHRYGGMLYQWDNMIDGSRWIFNAFGGSLMNDSGTESNLTLPQSIKAGEWMFQDMYWPGICTTRSIDYQTAFGNGTLVMRTMGSWELLPSVTAYESLTNFKWTILPFPLFPAGRATYAGNQFWGLNIQSKHPEQAWEVMAWASASTFWQTYQMQFELVTPTLVDLWDKWISIAEAEVPSLKGQGLSWYADAAQKGYGYPPLYYKYDDSEVVSQVGSIIYQLYQQTLTDVPEAFASAAALVDTIEKQAAQQAAGKGSSTTSKTS